MPIIETGRVIEGSGLDAPLRNAGAPTNSVTFAGIIAVGGLLIDTTNKVLYINTGTQAAPTYTVVGAQS